MIFRPFLAVALVGALAGVACTRASATVATPLPTTAASSPSAAPSPSAGSVPAETPDPAPVLPQGTFVARSRTPWLSIWRGPTTDAGKRWSF
ncbi:MAG: hypothetical protein ACXWEN_12365, partial [Actinomycetota bacterium]